LEEIFEGVVPPDMIVLIADDFEEHRLLMRQVIEKRGHRVVEAADGQETIDIAHRERPHLILLDLALPTLDGLSVARKLREMENMRSTVIIAVTAYDTYGVREAAIEAGCNEYLAKPVELEELATMMERMLEKLPASQTV
jgi:CheY-like chemotaxis protein